MNDQENTLIPSATVHDAVRTIRDALVKSLRPLIIAGGGMQSPRARINFRKWIETINVPFQRTRSAIDVLPDSHPLSAGRPGAYGQRVANELLHRADFLLFLGCRLGESFTGRQPALFGKDASKISIGIATDARNAVIGLNKFKSMDLVVDDVLEELVNDSDKWGIYHRNEWVNCCREAISQEFFDAVKTRSELPQDQPADVYEIVHRLSKLIPKESVVVVDGGILTHIVNQVFESKEGQRVILPSGLETPYFALPASIGIAHDRSNKTITVITSRPALFKDWDLIRRFEKAFPRQLIFRAIAIDVPHYNSWTIMKDMLYPTTGLRDFVAESVSLASITDKQINYRKLRSRAELKTLENCDYWGSPGLRVADIDVSQAVRIRPRPKYRISHDGRWTQESLSEMD